MGDVDRRNMGDMGDVDVEVEQLVLRTLQKVLLSSGLFERRKNPKREGIFAEFEVLIAQLQHHRPQLPEKYSALNAKLSDLAHVYCVTPVDADDFLMHRECLSAIKSLRQTPIFRLPNQTKDPAWSF